MKTVTYKLFILLCLFVFGAIMAHGFLYLISWYYNIELKTSENIFDFLSNDAYAGKIKVYIALNHILSFLIFPYVFLLIFYKNNVLRYLSLKKFNLWLIPLFLLLLFSLYPLMAYIAMVMNKIDWPPFISGLDNMAMESLTQLLKMDNFTDLLINITLIGIIPGITEEFLFRGIIQKELKNVVTNYHIPVWLTAIFFGVMHFQIIGLFPKIIIGAVLGYAYHYSGSLLLPMLIHIFNNSFATVAYYFNPMSTIETGSYQEEISFLPVFLFTIMALIIFNYIHNQSKIPQHANE